jgi:hypothetical protein
MPFEDLPTCLPKQELPEEPPFSCKSAENQLITETGSAKRERHNEQPKLLRAGSFRVKTTKLAPKERTLPNVIEQQIKL